MQTRLAQHLLPHQHYQWATDNLPLVSLLTVKDSTPNQLIQALQQLQEKLNTSFQAVQQDIQEQQQQIIQNQLRSDEHLKNLEAWY